MEFVVHDDEYPDLLALAWYSSNCDYTLLPTPQYTHSSRRLVSPIPSEYIYNVYVSCERTVRGPRGRFKFRI